ncbi:MAG: PDZ domain-containing protein [Firmicutes bacterium]|nr:PDZ domain-containing protein [Bacillota bacterium]
MPPLWELFELVVQSYVYAILGVGMGTLFPFLLMIVLTIVFMQHNRQAQLETQLFGMPFSRPLRQTLVSLGYGLIGGLLASMLMVSLGIALSESTGIQYVWPVVILLMMIRPRFMCFAYGGGIVGVLSLLLKGLAELVPTVASFPLAAGLMAVDLPSLMALVALLHLTESFLIFVSGHINASPIIMESPRGEVVGGFMLQRFWPLPLAALLAMSVSPELISGDSIAMPDWWPLLQPGVTPEPGSELLLTVLPIVAALGYSDIAVAHSPKEKSRISARNLLLYSIVLLGLALIAGHWRFLQLLPVLFAPLGHEYLIQVGNSREWAKQPRYRGRARGVTLLTVLPGSPAADKGLNTGWVVLNVNGYDVNTRRELETALQSFPGLADLEMVSPEGEHKQVQVHQRSGRLGLVPMPDPDEQGTFLKLQSKGFLSRKWEQWRKR